MKESRWKAMILNIFFPKIKSKIFFSLKKAEYGKIQWPLSKWIMFAKKWKKERSPISTSSFYFVYVNNKDVNVNCSSSKVNLYKLRGEISLLLQLTIECVFLAYLCFLINFLMWMLQEKVNFITTYAHENITSPYYIWSPNRECYILCDLCF